MSSPFSIHRLSNGAVLLAEKMDHVSSASFSIALPFGVSTDPYEKQGLASVLVEMLAKGAAGMNALELSRCFEDIGVRKTQSAGVELSIFSGAMLGDKLSEALELGSKLLFDPLLPEGELESVRELALQELASLEDEPSSLAMAEFARRFYPEPFGRYYLGNPEGLAAIDISSVVDYHSHHLVADKSIIAVAGNFNWPELVERVESSFSAWGGSANLPSFDGLAAGDRNYHIPAQSAQVQLVLAFPSVGLSHEYYHAARVAVGVLSGGMAGRLFVELREKRGLVYRVCASHSAVRDRAAIFVNAGTTPENAQRAFDLIVRELGKMRDGIAKDELQRAKADLKSRLVIHGESTMMRASSMVNEWWNMGELRTLSETLAAIDRVDEADVLAYFKDYPADPLTVLSLGPNSVELSR